MGLWNNLLDGYNTNQETISSLYPLSTTSVSNANGKLFVIVIDGDGNFRRVRVVERKKIDDKTKEEIVPLQFFTIPVTEASIGRTRQSSPSPIFDKYEYLCGTGSKFESYIKQLKELAESDCLKGAVGKMVKAVYYYEQQRHLGIDIKQYKPKLETYILFSVEMSGDNCPDLWKRPELFEQWNLYYVASQLKKKEEYDKASHELVELNKRQVLLNQALLLLKKQRKASRKVMQETSEALPQFSSTKGSSIEDSVAEIESSLKALADIKQKSTELKSRMKGLSGSCISTGIDCLTGEECLLAASHPKKILNSAGNAKLISDNDDKNFTYRGRFLTSEEALSIGYKSSQKVHQFLRYLANDRGIGCGEQVLITFSPVNRDRIPSPPVDDCNLCDCCYVEEPQNESEKGIALNLSTGMIFSNMIRKALYSGVALHSQHDVACLLMLDAATSGRLSITYYRELTRNEYFESIANWHGSFQWQLSFWNAEKGKEVHYVGAPAVDRIIEAVYGWPRAKKDESYLKIKKNARSVLTKCIFDDLPIPSDYLLSALYRASNPLAIVSERTKGGRMKFDRLVAVTCAIVNKVEREHKRKGFDMAIELERTDRDYLYGRLLGAADKLEEDALWQKGNNRIVTAALRYMQLFAQHPFTTWTTIHDVLVPYIQQVKGRLAFQEIQQIAGLFNNGDFENDKPLNGSYLIGYYHERAHIAKRLWDMKQQGNADTSHEERKEEGNE